MFPQGENAREFALVPSVRDKSLTHAPAAALAARQHGVVSARQLAAFGYSSSTISREAEVGLLHEIHRGVYAVGHPAVSRHGRCLAAVLACGADALLSHHAAAWLWGLTRHWRTRIDVTANSPRHQRPDLRVHSSQRLRPEDRAKVDEIPVTSVPRTLLDFAAAEPRFLTAAVNAAERLDLFDLRAIDSLLVHNRGRRGSKRLRNAIEAYRIPAFTRSSLERHFLQLIRGAELPRPSINLFVAGYELDAYWPRERFAVELDTYDYHGDRRSFEADRVRHEDLKLAGIEMVRITGARLAREPQAVLIRLRTLLARRRRDLQLP